MRGTLSHTAAHALHHAALATPEGELIRVEPHLLCLGLVEFLLDAAQ